MQYILHHERLAACFIGTGAVRTATTLATSERFSARLLQCTARHYRLSPKPLDFSGPDDRQIADRDFLHLNALAVGCGCVIWSSAIAREIRGEAVGAMISRFGAPAMALARTNRDLAMERTLPDGLDALEAAVLADGTDCLAAWIAIQPTETQSWLSLKWRSDEEVPVCFDTGLLQHGPLVLRRVATVRA